jgi:thymidylate kinase
VSPLALTIHLEGMDLAGKSTVSQHLASALSDCRVRRNSLVAANPVYDLADRLRKEGSVGEVALGQLYVAALAVDLEQYRPPQETVIQDSTLLLRSLAYHTAAGNPSVSEALKAMLPQHPRFSRSVVLTAYAPTLRLCSCIVLLIAWVEGDQSVERAGCDLPPLHPAVSL